MGASIAGMTIVVAIFLAVYGFCKLWEAVFNPMPATIEDARPGTMLVTFVRQTHDGYAETDVVREECDTTDSYYIEEMAADRLAEQDCVKVELKSVDGRMYNFTRLSIKARGW